jgi:hypothetical protein
VSIQDILLKMYAKEFRGDEDVDLHIITKEASEMVKLLSCV